MSNEIIEVFGQYAAQIDGKAVLFPTQADAQVALAVFNNGAENLNLARQYCDYLGLEVGSKNAVGKINVITSFLSYCDAGRPQAEPVAELPPIEYTAPEEEIQF